MKVTLVSSLTPFWHLMDDENDCLMCSLNDEEPGPVELDWESLTKSQRSHVHTGVMFGIIEVAGDLPPVEDVPVVQPERPVYGKEERAEEESQLREELVSILKGGIRQVKAHTSDFEDVKRVAMLFDLERRGKRRKGLISYLGEKLKELKLEEEKAIMKDSLQHPAISRGLYTGGDIIMEDAEVALFGIE